MGLQRRFPLLQAALPCLMGIFIFGWLGDLAAANEPRWEEHAHYRRRPLNLPPAGRTGFARLAPEATGIFFTNQVRDAQLARNQILEIGSGVALGDVDGDDRTDLYLAAVNGPNRLYRNLGGWQFEDITAAAGVGCPGQYSTGAVFADVDGDGDVDLLVNSLGGGTRLLINQGQARFTEATQTGFSRQNGSTTLALADVNGDGWLDVYTANYRTNTVKDSMRDLNIEVGYVNGKLVVSPPGRLVPMVTKNGSVKLFEVGEPDALYLNQGQGVFAPLAWTNGAFLDAQGSALAEPPRGWGLTAAFRDLNGDGAPDLYVCNDFFHSPDDLWINNGAGKFQALAALQVRHTSMSSMAIDFADFNRDGADDFLVTDMLSREHQQRQRQRGSQIHLQMHLPISDPAYRPEYPRNTLFLNRGDGTYAEIAQLSGVEASEWTWSVVFLDVDLDGYEDALITTGNLRDANDADRTPGEASRMEGRFGGNLRFPRLETPNLLFRNQRDLTFKDYGKEWGFDANGISQAMALADLDNDGGLDVVVNNMLQPAGIYRNLGAAPRVAVRLAGCAPNTQGIGAKIILFDGAVPRQSQEIMSGGRYLSGDDPLRVFAAGSTTNRMRLEVTWRSGARTVVAAVEANYLYEIREAPQPDAVAEKTAPAPTVAETRESAWANRTQTPLFEDVSDRLKQPHYDAPFDDLSRQPMLARTLSRLGPGVSWYDCDSNGYEDLIVGAGQGGYQVLYVNDGRGGFKPMRPKDKAVRDQTTFLGVKTGAHQLALIAGLSNYEDGRAKDPALLQHVLTSGQIESLATANDWSVGPLALGIVGPARALFVGGRVRPGQYPEAAPSQLYLDQAGRWVLDATNSSKLKDLGLVSGATWSDLDDDGQLELLLACEWGPVRVFSSPGGVLKEITADLGLEKYVGWWNGVSTIDADGDGRLDIVASNWGRNTRYERHRAQPLRLYYGDFNGSGGLDLLEAYYDADLKQYVPGPTLDVLRDHVPALAMKFATFAAYARAGIDEILGEAARQARYLEANWLETTVFKNRGGRFEAAPLPAEAQFSPAFGIAAGDVDGDGCEDVFLSQNFFGVDAETSRYDAGRGLWLRGNGRGEFTAIAGARSGVMLYGEQRGCALCDFDGDGRADLAVGQNNGPTGLFRNVGGLPGLRVRLRGPSWNPEAIGAVIRLQYKDGFGPARVITAGTGYWSQAGVVQVLGFSSPPASVRVKWPGGQVSTQPIAAGAREVSVVSPER